jgi:hypothetical protein
VRSHRGQLTPGLGAAALDGCRLLAALATLAADSTAAPGLKVPDVPEQLDAATLTVHHAIKTALDPAGILSPGRGF